MKQQKTTIALVLSIIAILLSVYPFYQSLGYKIFLDENIRDVSVTDDFKKDVYTVIDAYVAEKSGDANQPPVSSGPVDVSLDDDAIQGDKNAPVTILEFSDFQCPFCGKFFNETLPQITQNYIETGKAMHIFRDFPLDFHPNAIPAANAAECVRDQAGDETYWVYHDILFKNQNALSAADLKAYAAQLDIDQSEFTTCVDQQKFASEVAEDAADGRKYGVNGTPGFLILAEMDKSKTEDLKAMELIRQGQYIIEYIETKDGQQMGMRVSGAQPYSIFEAIINTLAN